MEHIIHYERIKQAEDIQCLKLKV